MFITYHFKLPTKMFCRHSHFMNLKELETYYGFYVKMSYADAL